MSYEISDDIPLPEAHNKGLGGRARGCKNPWTRTLDALEPGQSTITTEHAEYRKAETFKTRRADKRFAIRKIAGEGWRIWRVA